MWEPSTLTPSPIAQNQSTITPGRPCRALPGSSVVSSHVVQGRGDCHWEAGSPDRPGSLQNSLGIFAFVALVSSLHTGCSAELLL